MTDRERHKTDKPKPDEKKQPGGPLEGLVGRRGYAEDPLENAGETSTDTPGSEGTKETRYDSDPKVDKT